MTCGATTGGPGGGRQGVEGTPARVGALHLASAGGPGAVRATPRADAPTIFAAQRGQRQAEEQSVPRERLQVEMVGAEGIGVLVSPPSGSVQLPDRRFDAPRHSAKATAARTDPSGADGAVGLDPADDDAQHHVHRGGPAIGDAGVGNPQLAEPPGALLPLAGPHAPAESRDRHQPRAAGHRNAHPRGREKLTRSGPGRRRRHWRRSSRPPIPAPAARHLAAHPG